MNGMWASMTSLELKECTKCHQKFPKTSEYFFQIFRRDRGRSYLEPKCKKCSHLYNQAYKKAHAEKLRENQRRHDKSPKGIYRKLKASGELIRNHEVTMTQEQFIEWYKSQPKRCYYCGLEENRLQLVSDRYNNKNYRLTIDRMDNLKQYSIDNIALCCLRCNHIKGDFFTASEMVEIGQKYIAKKWTQDNGKETH